MIAVILAGGLGLRLKSVVGDMPKCLVPFNNIPLIGHQLDNLRVNGVNNVIILTGYGHDQIRDFCGNGDKWSLNIKYVCESVPLGTAGALRQLRGRVSEDVLLVSGDIFFDFCFSRMHQAHNAMRPFATVAVHPSDHPYDANLLEIDENDFVTGWHLRKNRPDADYFNLTNLSLQILSPNFIEEIFESCFDLWDDMFPQMIKSGKKILIYRTSEYIRDIGTPERYCAALRDYELGLTRKRNFNNTQKAIFIDRDGVINHHQGYINDPNQLELIRGSAEAIKIINDSGYLVICITNQPQIAKGMCDLTTLARIHKKLETLLAKEGAYLDCIYFCPHGYGIDTETCNCRKPSVGMLLKARNRFNLNLSDCYMIGDATRDIQTGINAKMKTILVKTGLAGTDNLYDCLPDLSFNDLYQAIATIFSTCK